MKLNLLLIISLLTAMAGEAQINDHLVAYYPFNHNGLDATGHGFNGKIEPTYIAYAGVYDTLSTCIPDRFGKANSAYFFYSQNSPGFSVDTINTALFYSACSVSFWFNATSTDNNYVQVFNQNGTNQWLNAYFVWVSPNIWQLFAQFGGAPQISSQPTRWFTDAQWNNFILTCSYKSKNATEFLITTKAYFNGTYVAGDSIVTPKFLAPTTGDLQMAENGYVCLDDIRLYNKVLSPSDISTLANDKPGGIAGISPVTNSNISIYPNPAKDKIYISEDAMIGIYNMNGRLIKNEDNKRELDVSGLKPGIYLLAIRTKDGINYQKQVIEP